MKRRTHPDRPQDSAFDLHARAELALAFDATDAADAPSHLYRREQPLLQRGSFRRSVLALSLAGIAAGTVLALRPPELVRGAIEHEYRERMLRGSFMEPRSLLGHLGLDQSKALPGFPQLMRPCDIDGHLVYHLTTFIEKGGMVTVFAFDRPVSIQEGGGWWGNVYWQVVTSREGKPLVMVSQEKKALAAARASFGSDAGPPAPRSTPG